MLQTGEEGPDAALAARLDEAYYALTRATARHFGLERGGWFLTGVAGLDASTMNRAVVTTAPADDVEHVLDEAEAIFAERDASWSVVLSSFRPHGRWHQELVMRGLHPSSTLDVLVRPADAPPLRTPALAVREAGANEVARFTDILMDVFRMPRRFYPALLDMTEAWRRRGGRLYLGELDGEPVATALLAELDGVAGIYNVGTMRHARRLGYARALMARALEDARGADLVTLQVAPEGFVEPFYLGLGFEQTYRWTFYAPRSRLGFFGR